MNQKINEKTNSDIVSLFYRLMPRGKIWVKTIGGILYKLLKGIADQFVRNRKLKVTTLFDEADPRTAVDTIDQWESEYDIPNNCSGIAFAIADRQAAVHAAMTATGGQSREYYIEIAKNSGLLGPGGVGDPQIHEYYNDMFTCISNCNALLYGPQYQWIWEVRCNAGATADQKLNMECLLDKLKPAHTEVRYTYT